MSLSLCAQRQGICAEEPGGRRPRACDKRSLSRSVYLSPTFRALLLMLISPKRMLRPIPFQGASAKFFN